MPELAAELIRVPVSMIVVQGAAVAAVRKLNLPVPVVYVTSGDPVLSGFAESFARPGGNMTGMTFMSAEMNEKRLDLLREVIPELRRVAIIANPDHPGEELERKNLEETAGRNGLTLSYFQTRNQRELTTSFDAMGAEPPQAICLLADGFAVQNSSPSRGLSGAATLSSGSVSGRSTSGARCECVPCSATICAGRPAMEVLPASG